MVSAAQMGRQNNETSAKRIAPLWHRRQWRIQRIRDWLAHGYGAQGNIRGNDRGALLPDIESRNKLAQNLEPNSSVHARYWATLQQIDIARATSSQRQALDEFCKPRLTNSLDNYLDTAEPCASFHDARLVSVPIN